MPRYCNLCKWEETPKEVLATVKLEIIVDIHTDYDRYMKVFNYYKCNRPQLCQSHYEQALEEFKPQAGDFAEPKFSKIGFKTKDEAIFSSLVNDNEQLNCILS